MAVPQDFLRRNTSLWAQFPRRESGKLLLVEEPSIPMVNHGNGLASFLLHQARGFTPVIYKGEPWLELFRSYVACTEAAQPVSAAFFTRYLLGVIALMKFLRVLFTKNLLDFSFDGVRYGDLVYDEYLAKEQVATIRRFNGKVLWLMYRCISRHAAVLRVIRRGDISAVLVSDKVSFRCGILLRAALRHGIEGYVRSGHHEGALQRYRTLGDIYNYAYKPSSQDVDLILAQYRQEIASLVEREMQWQLKGKGSEDAAMAFAASHTFYKDRRQFCVDFSLDPTRKNVFVMLHAMNDYPHSHFPWMVFRDFYDWFIQTLAFASRDPSVNWIFKQHPSVACYPVRDIKDFRDFFRGAPSNVVFIDRDHQIDTRSLLVCADAVITCIGSAGFELPALARIPAVVGGASFYTGLGFTREPTGRREYFAMLADLQRVGPVTRGQQERALATYLFTYRLSRTPFSACPVLSLNKQKDRDQNQWYWESVLTQYETNEEKILKEMQTYIEQMRAEEFTMLPSLQFSLQKIANGT